MNVDKPHSNFPNNSQDSRKANESINQRRRFNEETSNPLHGSSLDDQAPIVLDTTTPSGFGTVTNVPSMILSGLSDASQGHSEVSLSNVQACTSSSSMMAESPQQISKASSPLQQQSSGIRDSIPSTPRSKTSALVPTPIRPSVFGTVFTTSLCLCNKVEPPSKLLIQRNEDDEDEESVALALMADIPDSPICPGFSFDDLPLPALTHLDRSEAIISSLPLPSIHYS